MTPVRRFWLRLHRWAGIAMALPLILAALTGSILAFYSELERAINPQRYPTHVGAARLGAAPLIEHAQRHVPQARIKMCICSAMPMPRTSCSNPALIRRREKNIT
jgi:uncharacterized iron-regulated membrane protein